VRAPIELVYGNCVFGSEPGDVWAAFAVPCISYQWLSPERKRALLAQLVGALGTIDGDLQIVRVSRRLDTGRYAGQVRRLCRDLTGPGQDYVRHQATRLRQIGAAQPAVYLMVSLGGSRREPLASFGRRRSWLAAGGLGGRLRRPRLIGVAELERAQVGAERVRAHLSDFIEVRPARSVELQWLVRRAFCRDLGEPEVEDLHEPRALLFEHNGRACLAPLEGEVVRWCNSLLEHRLRCLRVHSEMGESWQALLALGSLPETVEFPGHRAELMFAPLESLPFDVDVSLTASAIPNGAAVRLARRRIQDADQIVRAESDGELGVSEAAYRRSDHARDLLAYLQSATQPALLRTTVTLAVGASSEEQLSERVDACRRAYGEVRLHRPLGDQLALFLQHLPAQRTRVVGYDDTLTLEQVAAMMPLATHAVGSRTGFYLGHGASASRRPVRFHLKEGSERDRNTAILAVGALGSGKTTLAQKLAYEAFLQGARVVDFDPKGDHRFHQLEDVAPCAETIALRPEDRSLHGVLDPLRVAPAHLRQEATVSFLCELLPSAAKPTWETAVMAAVDRVTRACSAPTCREVVRALLAGDEADVEVGKAIAVYSRAGLTQLGFADAAAPTSAAGGRQVTHIAIRDLPAPPLDAPRSEYTQAERIGVQIMRLIAMLAMDLLAREPGRLKVFCLDEGWRLLADPVGRTLLSSLQRMGRSEMAVPIVSTQLVGDTLVGERESLEGLLGATFVFGQRADAEAERALALLGLQPDDPQARALLLEMEAGRCLFKDHRGRVEAVQVELAAPWLARSLSTTPEPAGR
jgi:AAA-like domain